MKSTIFKIIAFILGLFEKICLLGAILLIISILVNLMDNPKQYPALMKVYEVEEKITQPMIKQIKTNFPYRYNGVDYSKGILVVLLFILMNISSSVHSKIDTSLYRIKEREDYLDWRERMIKNLPKEKIAELDSKFAELNKTTKDRKELLKEFATLKSQLDSMGQYLAFLAIDVVDSTGMKRDEDKHIASYDFDRYNQIVFECLHDNGVVKYAMTPDGIMSCFKTADNAVQAATDLIDKLKVFNKKDKQMKRDFQVRCGINTGFVYVDEDTPLEQVSDRAIDIAGHMQKHAKPNCINIAGSAIEPLKNREGFLQTTDVIDEQIVYELKKS